MNVDLLGFQAHPALPSWPASNDVSEDTKVLRATVVDNGRMRGSETLE